MASDQETCFIAGMCTIHNMNPMHYAVIKPNPKVTLCIPEIHLILNYSCNTNVFKDEELVRREFRENAFKTRFQMRSRARFLIYVGAAIKHQNKTSVNTI